MKPDPATVLVVPWRDKGDEGRRRNLRTVCDHLYRAALGPVYVSSDGRAGDAPFNRSVAYNRAVAAHPATRLFVFCEADLLVPHEQLRAAVAYATATPGMVVPFDEYRYLDQLHTVAVCVGLIEDPFTAAPQRVMPRRRSVGACNVLSADSLAAAGGWDEAFEGWGFDDRAMEHAFKIATRQPTRFVPGPGVHLYHVPGWSAGGPFHGGADTVPAGEADATRANQNRYRRYLRAKTPEQVRRLTGNKHAVTAGR